MREMKRPTGITILAVLNIVLGLLCLVSAAGLALIVPNIDPAPWYTNIAEIIGVAVTIFVAIMGVGSLVVAWGMWTGQSWAWYLLVILYAMDVVSAVVSFNILGVVIPAIILYYLFQSHVRQFFKSRR